MHICRSRLHIVHVLGQVLAVLFLWRFVFLRSASLRSVWRSIVELLTRAARMLAVA